MDSRNLPRRTVPEGSDASGITATIYNKGVVEDLSGSPSVLFHAKDMSGNRVTLDGAASFVTDGSDGKVTHDFSSEEVGQVRKLYCEFEIVDLRAEGNGNLVSELFILDVVPRAKVP